MNKRTAIYLNIITFNLDFVITVSSVFASSLKVITIMTCDQYTEIIYERPIKFSCTQNLLGSDVNLKQQRRTDLEIGIVRLAEVIDDLLGKHEGERAKAKNVCTT